MTFLRRFSFVLTALLCAVLVHAQNDVDTLNLTFTTIDVPGAVQTNVSGINSNGDMVGWYIDAGNAASGFLLKGGVFSYLNYPGASDTVVRGINDSGVIVGYAYLGNSVIGFQYDGTTFTRIRVGSYPTTYAEGISGLGDIVGGYGFGASNGFEISGSKHKIITPPGSDGTVLATGINNLGQVVGWTSASDTSGFFYSRGRFQTLTVPGSNGITEPWGINNKGIIVGSYMSCTPGCGYHGFALMKGKYVSVDYPEAAETFVFGISPSGQIVGSFDFGLFQTVHGYVTSPIASLGVPSGR